jgi:hypothetical protein
MLLFTDLSPDDEKNLPLPQNWVRTSKISLNSSGGTINEGLHYKNIRTGLETEDNPFIIQALNSAKY